MNANGDGGASKLVHDAGSLVTDGTTTGGAAVFGSTQDVATTIAI